MMWEQKPRQPRRLKNSDSDYKAEDEGSASDNKTWRKSKKAPFNLRLTKKEIIENSIKTLLPTGEHLRYDNPLTPAEYETLSNTGEAEELELNFRSMLGKVLEVVDGEVYRIAVLVHGRVIKASFRLNAISTPGLKKTEARDYGNYVKKIMKEMVEGKVVRLETGEYDKLGRIYVRMYAYTAEPLALMSPHSKGCS
jgi:hypothetical protein